MQPSHGAWVTEATYFLKLLNQLRIILVEIWSAQKIELCFE